MTTRTRRPAELGEGGDSRASTVVDSPAPVDVTEAWPKAPTSEDLVQTLDDVEGS
jgi:hypothetical protein